MKRKKQLIFIFRQFFLLLFIFHKVVSKFFKDSSLINILRVSVN